MERHMGIDRKKVTTCFVVLCLLLNKAHAQFGKYRFSSQIDSLVLQDTTPFKFQFAAVDYSFIGEYRKAIATRDQEFKQATGPGEASQAEKELISRFHPVDARTYILQQAAHTRIIMINEAHHIPLHRAYVATLLKDLQELGYTYLGLEALDYADSLLNKRKYPVLSSGYYIKEPCFGNLVRNALELGYTVFPYEKKYTDSVQKTMNRDLAEAINIKQVMDHDPRAKFIIYCGYDHVGEDSTHNFMVLPMAAQIKRLTGIDPFTIDQTRLLELAKIGTSRYRNLIRENDDCVLVDSNRQAFNDASTPKKVDCNLYHPPTSYVHGRPAWILDEKHELIDLAPKIRIGFPCLVKIYLADEDRTQAVPTDVVEITDRATEKYVKTDKKRRQLAVVTNERGEEQVIHLR